MSHFSRICCLFLLVILVSCSTDEGTTGTPDEIESLTLSPKELEFIEEYEYVTFNLAPDSFGANLNEKWEANVNVFLQGELSESYRAEVANALEQFNNLVGNNLEFKLVNAVEESNVHLIFGEKEAIREVWPDMYNQIELVDFQGYALYKSANGFKIFDGRIWVRNASIPLFRHELGHVIGLGHASTNFCDRNFTRNQSFMCSFLKEDFSVFDEAIIQTLYKPEIKAGLPFSQLRPIIEQLLLTDVILVE
ncbi:MAG: DUF2927 domain-containing protein [Maribacter sp.]|uniref:DUF2927 domain-containing protein n=1 Tax=Maribacter sp. TaxID=1897614 RepID=UPI0032976DEF